MSGLNNNNNEASTAPQPDRWYNLTLGSSFKDDHSSSNKFCTLRYEFKPASIDKDQRGSLHKSKDNKVTVEFQNNQPGKPKVVFEGSTEDCKETDAVLFFDGESIRLERLHRAVKRLRHNRAQGESNAAVVGGSDGSSPPVGKGNKHQGINKDAFHQLPVEVERIEVGDFKSSDAKSRNERTVDYHATQAYSPNPSPDLLDIVNNNDDDDDDAVAAPVEVREYETGNVKVREFETGDFEVTEHETGNAEIKEYDTGIDINIPHQADTDDEIADVDVSDDDEADTGPNAAEALKAQLNAQRSSSSSDSSDNESSDSGSGSGSSSSSSDGESSDANTVNSI